ncbi:hypothetical protein M0R04_02745 [Candidatus Dojkabacteria bacterium]|nr:hypothetical protein [Candidatus Dojkabacteria bacterium]
MAIRSPKNIFPITDLALFDNPLPKSKFETNLKRSTNQEINIDIGKAIKERSPKFLT